MLRQYVPMGPQILG